MTVITKRIPLDLIELDEDNVRFGNDVAESQKEALHLLMEDPTDAKKLLNLAKHISKNGLDPTELQLAFPNGTDSYTVIEGNRRLAALKLLVNPSLCPVERLADEVASIAKDATYKVPKDLLVSIVETREQGDLWVELKHTGENDGVGRVGWNSEIRDERRSRVTGEETVGRQLRKLIEKNQTVFSKEALLNSKTVAITNLTRLFQSAPAQEFFQLVRRNRILTPNCDLKYIAPSVEYTLKMMADKDFTVNAIKLIDDIREFISKIPINISPSAMLQNHAVEGGQSSTGSDANNSKGHTKEQAVDTMLEGPSSKPTHEDSTETNNHHQSPTRRPRSLPNRDKRKYAIDWTMRIEVPRINDIYLELRKLKVEDAPALISIALRVFIELSCDYYIEKHLTSESPVLKGRALKNFKKGNNLKLVEKFKAAAEHLRDSNKMNKEQCSSIIRRAESWFNFGSIDHLHQYIHGGSASTSPRDANIIADQYKPFFLAIWS